MAGNPEIAPENSDSALAPNILGASRPGENYTLRELKAAVRERIRYWFDRGDMEAVERGIGTLRSLAPAEYLADTLAGKSESEATEDGDPPITPDRAEALGKLDVPKRAVMILLEHQDWSDRTIASHLGVHRRQFVDDELYKKLRRIC